MILILTISGMVCYGFARYITAPIIILKDASKKFAAGAFDVRTAACVGAQNGEISELAEALDCMAERIETDMNFQRQMIGELAKKNKSLIELNATRERFFGILAHDLKGSLGGLITITQMLTSDYDNIAEKNKKEYLIIARDNAENVYHLLENLLKWLMCQTEVLQPVHVMANLNSSIEKTIDLFRTDAGNKKISIETYYEGPETIEIDLNIFSTILRNLISNSIKFTRPGGKVIVRTERQNDLVRVSVQDDGVGIKLKTVETIFRVEKRVSTSGTFGETGTGIGLILCHELVKKLGGDLKIDSVENSGTTFLFDLPVTRTVTGGA
ncbi:MAG TPA: HAMP domain-containing sensor histidine kinase [Candidatus Wallbacteria bacterium]|nr:HAMP domain-containing sensor histidine kinase [Candidatus Wallbacteria bacterium]